MKRHRFRFRWEALLLGAALSLGGFGAGSARAAGRADLSGVTRGPGEVQTEAEDWDQVILVKGTEGYDADISYYKKEEGSWILQWQEAGYVGRSGISEDKKEGDGATPAGIYSFNMNFGLKEDPESVLPYHQVVSGDYWVDDPESAWYNCLVNTAETPKDWTTAEDLIQASPYYNYALNVDYNPDRIPGKGSAIFLHCFKEVEDQPSSGCICLPQDRVKELVCSITADSRIIICK